MDLTWAITMVSFLSGGAGAYLGSYLKKKGENLASHEDINRLVEQVQAVTQATKEIEASISDKSWDRQRRWELKREAVFSVIQVLLDANDALGSLARALRMEKEDDHPERLAGMITERAGKCASIIEAANAKRVLALIVCGRDLDNALTEMEGLLRTAAGKLAEGNINEYEDLAPKMRKQFARALFFARRELGLEWKGITPQSNDSSVAPSPAAKDPRSK